MPLNRRQIARTLGRAVALSTAWAVAGRTGVALGGSGGKSGESLSATGTFALQQGPDGRQQASVEAVYWIDYRGAKLFSTTPQVSKGSAAGVIGEIAVRDLVADFSIKPGVVPHFLMNTASIGALGGGTSILLVIETTTKSLGVYWSRANANGIGDKPEFDLIQLRPYAKAAGPVQSVSTTGAVIVQTTMDRKQVPLDAAYWIEWNDQAATLYTAIPEVRKTATTTQMIGEVAARDIAADFKLGPGTAPNFLLSTASLGAMQMGMSALFIVETTTNQVAVYRAFPKSTVQGAIPEVELLKVRAYDEDFPALPAQQ